MITPTIRMMKMIAGCGTLLPTRSIVSSIRPRNVCWGAVASVIWVLAPSQAVRAFSPWAA